jgi:hypothetical protein
MFREKKIALVAVASLAMSFFAFAEGDGYVRLLKTCGKGTGFTGATWDVKNITVPSEYNYLVSGNLSFSNKTGENIPAKSITFGELDGEDVDGKEGIYAAYYGTTFENDGAIFANGACWTYYSSVSFNGNISITSPKTKPFLFYNDGYREGYMNFKGMVSAEEECGIVADMEFIREVYPSPGYTEEVIRLFRATNLREGKIHLDDGEFLSSIWIEKDKVKQMVKTGEIKDAKTLIALMEIL